MQNKADLQSLIKQQVEAENEALKKQVATVEELKSKFNDLRVSMTRTGDDYQSQSTAALMGVRDRLKKQYFDAKLDPRQTQIFANGETYNQGASILAGEIAAIEKELSMRRQIQDYAQRYGEGAATYKFGDNDTQRALRDMQDLQTRTVNNLESISNQLAASGLFPKNMPAPRG